jgi:hypothetical protein
MKVLFFHNRYDQESVRVLEQYLNDPSCEVEVYDVFAPQPPEILGSVRIWYYPFIITKQFTMLEPDSLYPQLAAGVPLTVKLGCYYLDGSGIDPAAEQNTLFHVYVNEVLYSDSAVAETVSGTSVPVLTFTFSLTPPVDLHLRVEADGYLPFDEVIHVVGSQS